MKKWTSKDIPDLSGKQVIVTGANSGLGYEISKALVEKHALVIMACRNTDSGESAKQRILSHSPKAKLIVKSLDLASLESIKAFSEAIRLEYNRIHLLINNAGVMAPPHGETKDGFELQFGTNHIGHFVLTAKLYPLLRKTEDSRIVTVSSIASHNGEIHFEDVNFKANYNRWKTYQQSKLANLMFSMELNKRLETSNFKTRAYAAHPGVSDTNLFKNMKPNWFIKVLGNLLMPIITQPAHKGALPILYAATSPDVNPGNFYGPHGRKEHKGYPKEAFVPEAAKIESDREKLWDLTENLSNTKFQVCEGDKKQDA
ncbi:MAG: oxidoreductase [Bacteroidales bacterium]|jgi:NAD(P)-dependent dehydrogenase (short-subunit alcohol dehydrogenase family)|nr:oxidoreductase [Bacteroidales bacterium]